MSGGGGSSGPFSHKTGYTRVSRSPGRIPVGGVSGLLRRRTGVRRRGRLAALLFLLAPSTTGLLVAQNRNGARGREPAEDERARPVEVEEIWFPERIAANLNSGRAGWLPVSIELKNRRRLPQVVRIDGSVSRATLKRGSDPDFRMTTTVEVQPGPPKRVFLYLRYGAPQGQEQGGLENHRVRLRFFQAEREFFRREFYINNYTQQGGARNVSVLLSGRKKDPAQGFFDQQFGRNFSGRLRLTLDQIEEHRLPDDPLGYHSVDVVILRDFDEQEMERAQFEALRDWVYLGGHVILVPGLEGKIFSTRLVDAFLPPDALSDPRLGEEVRPGKLYTAHGPELDSRGVEWGKEAEVLAIDWRYQRLDPVDPQKAPPLREIFSLDPRIDPPSRERGERLYHELRHGSGRVGFLTIDDLSVSDPESRPFRHQLWAQILGADSPLLSGGSRWRQTVADFVEPDLVNFLKQGLSSDLGMWFFGGVVVVYLALIGPGLYFFLRRLNRLPWVVWTQPLLVALYVGLIFLTGYLTKGVLTQIRTVSVLRWRTGETVAERESYLGIFSSEDARYRVTAPGSRWLRPVFANQDEAVGVHLGKRSEGLGQRGRSIHNFRLDVWQTGAFAANDLVPFAGTLDIVRLEDGAGRLESVSIRNQTGLTITRGIYLGEEKRAIPVAGLPPGAGVTLSGEDLARSVRLSAVTSRLAPERDEPPQDEAEDFFGGDELTRSVVQPSGADIVRLLSSGAVFVGILDRRDDDFELASGANLVHRADFLVVHQ